MRFLLLVVCLVSATSGADILFYTFFPSISHQSVYRPLWRELSLRGHRVTVLAHNPINDPRLVNLTEIDLSSAYEFMSTYGMQAAVPSNLPTSEMHRNTMKMGAGLFELHMKLPAVQKLLASKPHYDLVIVEALMPFAYAFAARFDAPRIGILSLQPFPMVYETMGVPSHPIMDPCMIGTKAYENLDWLDRIESVLMSVWYNLWYKYEVLPMVEELKRQYLGEGLPFVGDVERNISLLLINTNLVINGIRPSVPSVVEFGMMHVEKLKPLPKDLQEILDEAKEGVVYFNLGTNVKMAQVSNDTLHKIVNVLSTLPYKVLWKWESGAEGGLSFIPPNVLIRPWFPQRDLLAHPNVRLFITQGGIQSLEETIVCGVPIVGMPFVGDQPLSVDRMTVRGAGLAVNPYTFTEQYLRDVIMEVARNPKYKNRMMELSRIHTDQPMTGLEKSVWWIEYVIRHKGAYHLRSPLLDIPAWKYYMLDVILIIFTFIIIICSIIYKLMKASKQLQTTKKDKSKKD